MGFNVLDTLSKLATESGFAGFFAAGGWQNLVMIVVACVLLYLGIVKGFEPLLLVGIAFGCLLANVSYFPGLDCDQPRSERHQRAVSSGAVVSSSSIP